jgi:type II secretory pathway pseudopilin PulG
MEGKSIVSLLVVLVFIAYLMPVGMNAYSGSRDVSTNESEQLVYYNSLNASDKANYTSDYGGTGEAPTPWSTAEKSIFAIIGIIAVIAVVRGVKD